MQTTTIGILGGGQLGRMLIQVGLNYPVDFHVLDPSENAPCANICKTFKQGSFDDFDTVFAFGLTCDVITIEIEHVNVDALFELEKRGKRVIPSATDVKMIQDKGLQKNFYKEHGIATAEFILTENEQLTANQIEFLPAFHKLRRLGYDGKGVTHLNEDKLANAFAAPSVLEKAVDIDKELSVIVAKQGEQLASFPLVECVFDPKLNLVDYLICPAQVDDALTERAGRLAKETVSNFSGDGLFAIELFLNKNQQLLVNECAPRPHNSGHQSIEGLSVSQYEQLMRLLLGLPIIEPTIIKPSAMLNLIGTGDTGRTNYSGLESAVKENGCYVHCYGKEISKAGRKMGHVTILAESRAELTSKINRLKLNLKVYGKI